MSLALGLLIFGWIFVIVWTTIVVYTQKKVHPKALFALFFTEMWERFSFYGMRALLILYLTHELFAKMDAGEADARAYGVYGAYNALLYADRVILMQGGRVMADGQTEAVLTANLLTVAYNMPFEVLYGCAAGQNRPRAILPLRYADQMPT